MPGTYLSNDETREGELNAPNLTDKATKNPAEEGDDSGSEEEEEYEIEEVLDAKRGHFPDVSAVI